MPLPVIATHAANMGMGIVQGMINDARQVKQNKRLGRQNIEFAKEMADYNKRLELEMWEATGYVGQKRQLKEAGLNPGLMYGMSGGGGQTTGGSSGGTQPGNAQQNPGEMQAAMAMGMQLQLLKAQKENIEADTKAKLRQAGEGDAAKIDLAKTTSETENNILNGIVLKYAGEQARQQWEIDRELKTEKYGAQANELEARKAAADLILTLYENGTMKKLTDAQLDNLLKDIGLKTEQISARKLENAILELEKEMQTKLGLDKNSPGWIKIIGRLILGFMK